MFFLLCCLVQPQTPVLAQTTLSYYLPPDVTYDSSVPTPESYFGFQVGEWHLRPDQITGYLEHLSKFSNRISIEQYGFSYERRPLILVTITSPENHKRIDEIKEKRRMMTNQMSSSKLSAEDLPLVVWMGYSVHGNEPSGTNSTPLVAYHLAAAQGPNIDRLLRESVVLLDLTINPDGIARFAHWANVHRGTALVADPNNREHNEAWPGGRFNHYWFDPNRDWMPLQHPESQARISKYYEWLPHVLTDHHEMGSNSTFFFQPGIPSRNNPYTPERNSVLTEMLAQFHAKAFDKIGSLYYQKESFDDFYIGKGSSYPDVTGSIGILYEQASSRGHLQETVFGEMSFPFTIRNQFTVSLSTLEGALANKKDLLSYQNDFFSSVGREAERSPIKAYVFNDDGDPARAFHFLDLLKRHQIEMYILAKDLRLDGKLFSQGSSYIIPMNQRQFRLIASLFEHRTQFNDSLFYDISTWTLPHAFNLPFGAIKSSPSEFIGARLTDVVFPSGRVIGNPDPYAYVFEWNHYYSPRALYRLLDADVKSMVASEPFIASTVEGNRRFGFGTIVVPLGLQKDKKEIIQELVERASKEDGIPVYALSTGMTVEGISLGSPKFNVLKQPKVMIVGGSGVSATDVGELWHLLDHRFQMEVSIVEQQVINRIDLSRYNSIVLVGGTYSSIDSSGRASLRNWIERGGILVAMKGGAEWAVQQKLGTAKFKRDDSSRRDSIPVRQAYADWDEIAGAERLPGSIFEIRYDKTHPLFFGYNNSTMGVFKNSTVTMELSTSPFGTPAQYSSKPLLSGYAKPSHLKSIGNSAAITVSGLRSGKTILMVDGSNFRSFWYGTNKIFLNALFFGSTIRTTGGGMFEPEGEMNQ